MKNWSWVRLDWLMTEKRRTVDPTSFGVQDLFHYSIPVFDELGDGRLEPAEDIGSGKLLLKGGEVLISKLNPRLPRVLRAEAHGVPTVSSTEFVALLPGPMIDDQFLRYWLASEHVRQQLDAATLSVTRSQQRVRPDILTKMWLRIPSLAEQQEIADFLDAETARIDALVATKRRLIRVLEERTSIVLNELFSTTHLLSPDSTPIGFPGHVMVRLGYVAEIQSGITLDERRVVETPTLKLPYLRVANVQDGWLDLDEVKTVAVPRSMAARCRLQSGDVLMTEGGDPDKLGRGTVWSGEVEPCLHQNHIFAVRPDKGRLLPEYLALVTRTAYARRYFEVTASKTTGIASTSTAKIAGFRVPLPPLRDQRLAVDTYTDAGRRGRAVRSTLARQIGLLEEHRQALITAAVTGELEIPGAAA
jgi:type I restriction enzyme, S subunit